MKEIIIATKNKGKVNEFKAMFAEKGMVVKSLLDYEDIPDIVEDGQSFAENAKIKAETIAQKFGKTVLADDSGLIIDALNGHPGIYSARYAGPEKDDQKNIEKVLEELKGVPVEQRTARFHCAIAVSFPSGKTEIVEGNCEGLITQEPIGDHGFGYDPIMYIPEKDVTMAQLPEAEKNQISHRAQALKRLEEQWQEIFN
ncbi:XTP/dITP diphosphatase [Desertibacillus haloalkaliphilus]|uniref:XTP/dITP diphosphatase n=1 Tax=Desertibacillus haloalkaliphilus TaxID=1328930 RepID=UPI001C251F3D|nr:XTP/dITP diphosphatase [Desertibacillus haloalkaliphilus]MBU8905089.1 XTP/dITP diphosphatase [Desertibacillus haloalkaliphilus]